MCVRAYSYVCTCVRTCVPTCVTHTHVRVRVYVCVCVCAWRSHYLLRHIYLCTYVSTHYFLFNIINVIWHSFLTYWLSVNYVIPISWNYPFWGHHAVRHAVMTSVILLLCLCAIWFHLVTFTHSHRWNYPLTPHPLPKVNLTHVRTYARVWISNCLYFSTLAYISICMQSHFSVYPFFKPLMNLFCRSYIFSLIIWMKFRP